MIKVADAVGGISSTEAVAFIKRDRDEAFSEAINLVGHDRPNQLRLSTTAALNHEQRELSPPQQPTANIIVATGHPT
jgi:hypothetical protein